MNYTNTDARHGKSRALSPELLKRIQRIRRRSLRKAAARRDKNKAA